MTFVVVDVGSGNEKVVGTVWAEAESEAQTLMSSLLSASEQEHVIIRRGEEREVPMKPFE